MYIQIEDYQGIISQEELDVITGSDSIKRQKAEKRAISKIKKWLGRQYNTELLFSQIGDDRDETLVEYTIYLALYILFANISKSKVPDDRYAQYEEAKKFFMACSKGEIESGFPLRKDTDLNPTGDIMLFGSETKIKSHSY